MWLEARGRAQAGHWWCGFPELLGLHLGLSACRGQRQLGSLRDRMGLLLGLLPTFDSSLHPLSPPFPCPAEYAEEPPTTTCRGGWGGLGGGGCSPPPLSLLFPAALVGGEGGRLDQLQYDVRKGSVVNVNPTNTRAHSETPEIRKYKKRFNSEILCAALWGEPGTGETGGRRAPVLSAWEDGLLVTRSPAPVTGVNLLVGTENGLMLLDRSGQGKVYGLIGRRRFQQMDVLEGLNLLITISGARGAALLGPGAGTPVLSHLQPGRRWGLP